LPHTSLVKQVGLYIALWSAAPLVWATAPIVGVGLLIKKAYTKLNDDE
jgi:hypothetical protein